MRMLIVAILLRFRRKVSELLRDAGKVLDCLTEVRGNGKSRDLGRTEKSTCSVPCWKSS
jgi:hypothetical protein